MSGIKNIFSKYAVKILLPLLKEAVEVVLDLFQTERNEAALLRGRNADKALHGQVKRPRLTGMDDISSVRSSAASGRKRPICRTCGGPRKGHPGGLCTQRPRYIAYS